MLTIGHEPHDTGDMAANESSSYSYHLALVLVSIWCLPDYSLELTYTLKQILNKVLI